jgi:hypothetical protein
MSMTDIIAHYGFFAANFTDFRHQDFSSYREFLKEMAAMNTDVEFLPVLKPITQDNFINEYI